MNEDRIHRPVWRRVARPPFARSIRHPWLTQRHRVSQSSNLQQIEPIPGTAWVAYSSRAGVKL